MTTLTRQANVLRNSFFDNTLDGVAYCQMLFDAHGGPIDVLYLEINKNFEKLTGLKQMVGKKITDVLPSIVVTNPDLLEICGQVSLTGEPRKFETYIQPLARWFLISVYSPKKEYFVTVLQNITDQKRAEQDLANAEIAARNVLEDLSLEKAKVELARAKEEAILLAIGDGLLVTDNQGVITLVNRAAEGMIGKHSADLVGRSIADVIPIESEGGALILPEKRPMSMALATATATTTTTAEPAYYYVRGDATRFPAAIAVTPVVVEGKVIGAIEVFRDITKEREVDRAKTEFVSLASHQLRTPLSSVRWYAEMLLDGDAGAIVGKQREYLEEIRHGNLRMVDLVNTLLNVSRLELETTNITLEPTALASVVTAVIKDLEPLVHHYNISVAVHAPETLPLLMTDPRLMHIVIENLVSNAIKYSQEKGAVEISLQVVPSGGAFAGSVAKEASLGLSVADTGIGIPQAAQDKIFQKLFRADNAREINTDGTGLGLYLTRLIIERMHGRIWFASRLGEGTTFSIFLPEAVAAGSSV